MLRHDVALLAIFESFDWEGKGRRILFLDVVLRAIFGDVALADRLKFET